MEHRYAGQRAYELKDHLGNVRVVISDEVSQVTTDEYLPTILTQTDYYPFGMIMETRSEATAGYRYGFNGKENDNDVKGTGNQQDFSSRIYDPRIGRFLSEDPLAGKMPDQSPYHFGYNSPILFVDPDGNKPTAAEAVRMARHVYGGASDDMLINGWRPSSRFASSALAMTSKDGLKAVLYERVVDGIVTEYTLAFAGTEGNLTGKDWTNNYVQLVGLSKQYDQAAKLAENVSQKLGANTELSYTGHSLGGGEAALAAMITKHFAITFNAAELSEATKLKHGITFESDDRIFALIHASDPLDKFQTKVYNPYFALPNTGADGKRLVVPPVTTEGLILGHAIEPMIESVDYMQHTANSAANAVVSGAKAVSNVPKDAMNALRRFFDNIDYSISKMLQEAEGLIHP